jgi:two-component SAPR family response regulator
MCKVMIVEDDYLIAADISSALRRVGIDVIGPFGTSHDARGFISNAAIDFAVIDINLNGEIGFETADALEDHKIPFLFATGYDRGVLPIRHAQAGFWRKPFNSLKLAEAIAADAAGCRAGI